MPADSTTSIHVNKTKFTINNLIPVDSYTNYRHVQAEVNNLGRNKSNFIASNCSINTSMYPVLKKEYLQLVNRTYIRFKICKVTTSR
jgi:hypothetical protein